MERGVAVVISATNRTRRSLRDNASRDRRRRAFTRGRALLAGALVLGLGATVTLAAWTDQENATAQLSAGTFGLESQVQNGTWGDHGEGNAAALPLNAAGMYPGQSRASWIQIRTKANSVAGTVSLTGVTASPTQNPHKAFADALTVRIGQVANTSACTTGFQGGSLATGIGTIPTGVGPVPVAAGGAGTVIFCVVVTLPNNAPQAAQGGSVSPTWSFVGTTPTG